MANTNQSDFSLKMYTPVDERRQALHDFITARLLQLDFSDPTGRDKSDWHVGLLKSSISKSIHDHSFIWNAVYDEALEWDINGNDEYSGNKI